VQKSPVFGLGLYDNDADGIEIALLYKISTGPVKFFKLSLLRQSFTGIPKVASHGIQTQYSAPQHSSGLLIAQ
jgi:hypothetical protein